MQITQNVYQLESSRHSHVFLIRAEQNILIDTGLPSLAGRILNELSALGVPKGSLRFILLTHHDVDHIGNACRLQEATGAALWASDKDMPYITRAQNRPGIKRVIGALIRVRTPFVSGVYADGQRFGEVRAIWAPGHTPGHTLFQYKNVLFTGDLFKVHHGRLSLLPGFMNADAAEVKKSAALIGSLTFDWLCPAHGSPIQNGPAVRDFLSACSAP